MKGRKKKVSRIIGMVCTAMLMVTAMPTVALAVENLGAITVDIPKWIEELGEQGKNEKHYYSDKYYEEWDSTPTNEYIGMVDYIEDGSSFIVSKNSDYKGKVECYLSMCRLEGEDIAEGTGQVGGFEITETPKEITFTSEEFGFSGYVSNRKDCIYIISIRAIPDNGSDPEEWEFRIRIAEKESDTIFNNNSLKAQPANAKVLVNGKETYFEAYQIEGNNYFKLRDLAMAVNGTAKQFEIGFDKENNVIRLTSNNAYTIVGGEFSKSGNGGAVNVSASNTKMYLDSKEISLTAYTIGGSNYFKLRDIARLFNIGITYDNATGTVGIDTSIGYTE